MARCRPACPITVPRETHDYLSDVTCVCRVQPHDQNKTRGGGYPAWMSVIGIPPIVPEGVPPSGPSTAAYVHRTQHGSDTLRPGPAPAVQLA